jgi:hypothetical protein
MKIDSNQIRQKLNSSNFEIKSDFLLVKNLPIEIINKIFETYLSKNIVTIQVPTFAYANAAI